MGKRSIIRIDEGKCTGCGLCIPNCPEGALQIIEGKARLVSDLFCDGLGACIGHCPEGAIEVEEREAEPYNETRVMEEQILPKGPAVIEAHLAHLKEHGSTSYLEEALDVLKRKGIQPSQGVEARKIPGQGGCPGVMAQKLFPQDSSVSRNDAESRATGVQSSRSSQLGNWPVQIALVNPNATYFQGANLLVVADCVPFAYAEFHQDFVRGHSVLVGCPKLDDARSHARKLADIFKNNEIRSVTCVHMEVPCCHGLVALVQAAMKESGKSMDFKDVTISLDGKIKG